MDISKSDNQNAKFMTTGVIQLKKVEKYISLKKWSETYQLLGSSIVNYLEIRL